MVGKKVKGVVASSIEPTALDHSTDRIPFVRRADEVGVIEAFTPSPQARDLGLMRSQRRQAGAGSRAKIEADSYSFLEKGKKTNAGIV